MNEEATELEWLKWFAQHADWKAGPEADAICAEKVMGWNRGGWCDGYWLDKDDFSHGEIDSFLPTTDRNAAALLLEEVGRRGRIGKFISAFLPELDPHGYIDSILFEGLRADPSLISYCCVAACEEESGIIP